MQHSRVNTRPLEQVMGDIRRGLRSGGSAGPVRSMLRQCGKRYLSAMKRRALKNSRGGGEWPALKPSTVRTRRKGGKKRGGVNVVKVKDTGGNVAILNNTGVLIGALQKGNPHNLFKDIRRGVRVGFGPTKHPDDKTVTIAQIARWHHDGAGNLPARKLLHDPKSDPSLMRGMSSDAERALNRMFKQRAIRGRRI